MPSFRAWMQATAPRVLRGVWGARYVGTLGYGVDRLRNAARVAAQCGLPSHCPDDALGYVGDARNLDRYALETTAAYRAICQDGWNQWSLAGTPQRIAAVVRRIGYANAEVIPWRVATTLTPAIPARWASWWSVFFVAIWPSPFVKKHWGSPPAWGATVPSHFGLPPGKATWGSDASDLDVLTLRRAVNKWKPADEIGVAVFKATAGTALFDPANLLINL